MKRIYRVTYASSAVQVPSQDELLAILTTSRGNNARKDITGLLLHRGGNFLQVLEGDETEVKVLLARIRTDPRHHGMVSFLEEQGEHRMFPQWSMGFEQIDRLAAHRIRGLSRFLQEPFTPASLSANPGRATAFLRVFHTEFR